MAKRRDSYSDAPLRGQGGKEVYLGATVKMTWSKGKVYEAEILKISSKDGSRTANNLSHSTTSYTVVHGAVAILSGKNTLCIYEI